MKKLILPALFFGYSMHAVKSSDDLGENPLVRRARRDETSLVAPNHAVSADLISYSSYKPCPLPDCSFAHDYIKATCTPGCQTVSALCLPVALGALVAGVGGCVSGAALSLSLFTDTLFPVEHVKHLD